MKYIQFILIFTFITQVGYSQAPKVVSDSDMKLYNQEIEKESIKVRQQLLKKDYLNDFDKQITIDFQIDTLKIEQLLKKRINGDYSTAGMTSAVYDSEIEYDKLLNKYYNILIKKLKNSDKEILKQSQKNWLQFRDSERKLNSEIAKSDYSGSGTIQGNIVAVQYLELTKSRTLDLYHYLSRFYK